MELRYNSLLKEQAKIIA
jgi:Zn-dependent M32 family carboxypeptidase